MKSNILVSACLSAHSHFIVNMQNPLGDLVLIHLLINGPGDCSQLSTMELFNCFQEAFDTGEIIFPLNSFDSVRVMDSAPSVSVERAAAVTLLRTINRTLPQFLLVFHLFRGVSPILFVFFPSVVVVPPPARARAG